MADYRWTSEDHSSVMKYPATFIVESGSGWVEFQFYLGQGGEVDPFKVDADYMADNAAAALSQQNNDMKVLEANQIVIGQGLPPNLSDDDVLALENNIQKLQNDIDRPGVDPVYVPPETPDSTPPVYSSLTATVTRVEGWQGNLGYRFVLDGYDDGFAPTNLAMAVYSSAECDGYLYTTGAFQHDSESGVYFAECPAGQEPGLAAINFGMLEGSAPIKCFTLPEGVMEQTFNVYV